ncbi:MAG: polysaccharide deacetylase family protein [Microbacteriaceae bacterium]|nr:polysaccharide deacetylase family protein [Microbacteriaceae bacterium]
MHSLPALGEITFDDSNESDYTHALPALLGLSLTATFFVITDRLDTPGSLSRPQLDLLHLAGMPIGTHGMTHRPWRGLARDGLLEAELVESCDALTEVIHRSISSAAFPQGDYDRRVLSTLRRLGFTRAYSVDEGSSRPSSWLHSRYTVVSSDTPDSVIARIEKPDRSFVESAARSGRRVMKGLR